MRVSTLFLTLACAFDIIKARSISNQIQLNDVSASSRLGSDIISKARVLEQGFEYDNSWLIDYSIQFQGCHSIIQYGEGQKGGEEGTLFMQNLVKFRLCPIESCNKNCKGLYLVDMRQFVEAYVQYQEEAAQMECQNMQDNCACDDDGVDDRVCLNKCYMQEGLENCMSNDDDGIHEEFEIERFLGCEKIQTYSDDDDVHYYVGPKCHKGNSILLDVFEDSGCIQPAPTGTYEKYNYNNEELPYAKQSIVTSDCLICEQADQASDDNAQNANDANDDSVALNQICDQVYEEAAKCERDLDIENPRNSECKFIKSQVLTHDATYKNPRVAIVFSWILLCTTLALGHKVMTLQNDLERSNVKLSDSEGGIIA